MQINDLIKIYDNAVDLKTVAKLIKYSNQLNFTDSRVGFGEGKVDKSIRDVQNYFLKNIQTSMTETFWFNYLGNLFQKFYHRYKNELKIDTSFFIKGFFEISILKYEVGGFYEPHIDHVSSGPNKRDLSFVLFLNNDYKGGELCFSGFDKTDKEICIEPKPGKLIVWPSYFMYPHGVKPVIEGKRFAIVGWSG